ncbi:hypothetical protein NBO_377g0001 [Nosema bombycis CQ1]|uniref:Uncharacterized protein n=1 Tax=Nosema bombycis (strain CQ1 / CVCC 102059) TaxID=578461 RepID=R0KPS0_NOSB1|nr:hypothetical protein NBO_377g0001 [Nosema bombycis CQ1]|eukprot:EOB12706.1 hypothetical protein NBO_377g0001 [Nosema bombycis CQ1]
MLKAFCLIFWNFMRREVIQGWIWRLSEFLRTGVKEENEGGNEGVIKDYGQGNEEDLKDYYKEDILDHKVHVKEDNLDHNLFEQGNIAYFPESHQNAIYSKYASKLIKIYESSKEIDFRLLNSALVFSLQMENLDLFESIVKIFMRINERRDFVG